jgi:CzcA family heavy metal efflux pump
MNLNHLINGSLTHRTLICFLAIIILIAGIKTAFDLPVEVLPDLTKPTVIILTEAPHLAPEEVEKWITQPLENSLLGIAGLTRLRSNSDVTLSLIYAEFNWNADILQARRLVQERLIAAQTLLPKNITPTITPVASLMGEILLIGIRSTATADQPHYIPPTDIRSLADGPIRRRIQSIPGIAEVLNMGGGAKRIEIQPNPQQLQAYSVSLEELEKAVNESCPSSTSGFIQSNSTEIMIRNTTSALSLNDIEKTYIKTIHQQPILIKDVATVSWGIEPMRGDATISRAPEKNPTYGVIMSITKTQGFDTRELTQQIQSALNELKTTFPPSVETTILFQQKDFIDLAIGNLIHALRDGALMVAFILFAFLLNFRITLITLLSIPLSFALTLLCFRFFNMSVNSMTLGGLAVAIGMVVDDAIVDVENVFRRLNENRLLPNPKSSLQVIAAASSEVRHSILIATTLIILVFIPLLSLSGVEGKLFSPIAIATITSMIASFIVSLTLIPVLCSFFLTTKSISDHQQNPLLIRFLKKGIERIFLKLALNHPNLVIFFILGLLIYACSLYSKMSKKFLPPFQEKTALVAATSAPGTSLKEMNKISDIIESLILTVPEVRQVGRRLGRAERGDHVVPVSTAEFDIDFHHDLKTTNSNYTKRKRKEILQDINQKIKSVPGVFAVVSGPLADRIGHMLSGVSAPIAIKIFGADLGQLRDIGIKIQELAKKIPGLENAKLDQTSNIPQLIFQTKTERASVYGITPGSIDEQLSTLIGGKTIKTLNYDQKLIPLVIRLPEHLRESSEKIALLPILSQHNQWIPIHLVTTIQEIKGPNLIFRENGQRRFVIAITPSLPNPAQLVQTLKESINTHLKLSPHYYITYEGEFRAQQEATQRILWFSIIIFIILVFILFQYFQSLTLAFQVLVNIPLALIGSLIYTSMTLNNISIATLVGFIAIGGIAARNGIMMISHYLHLMKEDQLIFNKDLIIRGTLERLTPVLMTALSAGFGLIPLLIAAEEPGKEILHPIAIVIVGGLISSTVLDFIVTPAIFWLVGRKAALQAIQKNAPATR